VQNKVFRIIADQAANNKKAFELEKENDKNDEIVLLMKQLLTEQKKEELKNKHTEWKKLYEKEREKMNAVNVSDNILNKKRSRDEIILDHFNDEDVDSDEDYSESTNLGDDTLDEVNKNDFQELVDDILDEEDISKSLRM
jgi:hypothetical protein